MNKWVSVLLLLLSISLALNFYFLLTDTKQNLVAQSDLEFTNVKQNMSSETLLNWTLTEHAESEVKQSPEATYKTSSSNDTQLDQAVTNRVELLAQATLWLKEKQFLTLSGFLQEYLKKHPQDMDFLLLEAKLKVDTILLSDAIAHYYDLLRNPMTAAQQSEIEQQIKKLSKNTIEQLKRNYSWDILAMFVEPLLQLDPDNRLYILSLAMAYAELNQEGLMENVLASLDFDDPDATIIRKVIVAQQIVPTNDEAIDPTINDVAANVGQPIPLKQYSDQFVVEAKLSSNPVALLIDTGASVTAISRHYFDNLSNRYKVNYLGRFNIGTAGGSVMAPVFQFRELTINQFTVQNLPVVILPMQGIKNADGLLGMNFLREFDFKIDQKLSVMFIK